MIIKISDQVFINKAEYNLTSKVIDFEIEINLGLTGALVSGYVDFHNHLRITNISTITVDGLVQIAAFLIAYEGFIRERVQDKANPHSMENLLNFKINTDPDPDDLKPDLKGAVK